ncbi:MAG TPA: hypothetical protein VF796_11250, partial [Humisphaera sp.]
MRSDVSYRVRPPRVARRHTLAVAGTLALAGLAVGGCKREQAEVREYTTPKESAPVAAAKPAARPAAGGPAAVGAVVPKWTLPTGWTQQFGGTGGTMGGMQMPRFATLKPADGSVELAVMQLPKQELAGNVARWEGMVGATPAAPAKVREVPIESGTATVVDAAGPGKGAEGGPQRLLGALVDQGGSTWSFRMNGPADKISAQAAAFGA